MKIVPFSKSKTLSFNGKFILIFLLALVILSAFPSLASAACILGGKLCLSNPFGSVREAVTSLIDVVINLKLLFEFGIPIAIYTGAVFVIASIMALLGSALGVFLGWFIETTLSIAVVPGPDTVQVVNAGWRFSRDFANLFFILILAFIGLATILRLRSYEFQKTLPTLIFIALLVNFSGVLVGIIVDISNIFTNFFISRITEWDLGFRAIKAMLITTMQGMPGILTGLDDNPIAYIGTLILPAVQMTLIAFFFAALVIILFLIMFMFIARVAILWILTILAPFAFLAYILPATRTWWTQWWSSLISWSIIGIPMTFFLYLSSLIITSGPEMSEIFKGRPDGLGGVLAELLVPITALIFLVVGFMISIQMAPAGAKAIMSYTKKGAFKLAKTRGGQLLLGRAAGLAQKPLEKTLAIMNRMERYVGDKVGGVPLIGKPLSTSGLNPLGWAGRDISSRLLKFAAATREFPIPKEFEQMSGSEQAEFMHLQPYAGDRLKVMDKAMSLGTFRFFGDEAKETAENDAFTLRADPHYAGEVGRWKEAAIGNLTEQMMIESAGPAGPEGEAARENMRQEIGKMVSYIEETFEDKEDELLIELGLRYKYTTTQKIETTEGRNQALQTIRQKLGGEKEQEVAIKKFIADTAAGAVQTEGLDVKDIDRKTTLPSTLTSLAFRMGSHNFAPAHIQKISSSFEPKVLTAILDRPGGLNAIFRDKSKEEGEELLKKFGSDPEHRRLLKWFFTSPVGRAIGSEGLKFMTDTRGNPTSDFADFELVLDSQKKINDIIARNESLREHNEMQNAIDRLARKHTKEMGRPAEERQMDVTERQNILTAIQEYRKQIQTFEQETLNEDPALKAEWDEVKRIKREPPRRGRTRRRRRREEEGTEEEEET